MITGVKLLSLLVGSICTSMSEGFGLKPHFEVFAENFHKLKYCFFEEDIADPWMDDPILKRKSF